MNYADWPLAAPVNLTWEITHQCNLNCIHCLSNSEAKLPAELTLEECKEVVDQLAALRVFEINFGGGEPFLQDYFLPLLDYIHARGIVTCISTNGTLLDEAIVTRLAENPLVHVQVSIDGATPEVNDRIRGEGAFRRALVGLELLSGNGVPLSINTVVTALNFDHLDPLRELAASFKVGMRISRFRPSGRARGLWHELKLDPLQLKELSEWLERHPGILTGDSFFSISDRGRREMGLDLCGACKLTCCIDPCGSVYPCAFLQEDEFCSGNLREVSLKEIWDGSPVFRKFRELEPESCTRCPRFAICRGGCPAVAYFVKDDLNSPDPECLVSWSREIEGQPVL